MHLNDIKLDNYAGMWCVEPVQFSQVVEHVNSLNLAAHVAAQQSRSVDLEAREFASVENGADGYIAVITVAGTMTKSGSSLASDGSTIRARRAIRQADRDPDVSAILMRFDTPGGTVAGTADLAQDIRNTSKPVIGFAEDLCASAGMWCLAQCDEAYANTATAKIGSIGTFMAVYDVSAALAEEKIRTVVIKAGEFKAGGFPGAEISDEQIAEWQKIIDATQAQFTQAIADGRGMSRAQADQLVTGLVYMADEAQQLNLIDGIKSFDQVVEQMRGQTPKRGTVAMSDVQTPAAATFAEIVAACPGIDTDDSADALMITEIQKGELSAADATAFYCASLRERLTVAETANTELRSEISELKASKKPGVPSVGTTTVSTSADPIGDFNAAVRAEQNAGKSKADAVRAVNKKQPELRQAMLAACN